MPVEGPDERGRPCALEVSMLLRLAQQGGSGVGYVPVEDAPGARR
jgi:hypothetical protein